MNNYMPSMKIGVNQSSPIFNLGLNSLDLANQICPKKYVFTGGPCTGKTSLIHIMGNKGYQTIPEASSLIIREQLENNEFLVDKSVDTFQRSVLKKQLELENRLSNTFEVFLDRSLVDGIAYYRFAKKQPPRDLLLAAENNRYKKVFFLDFLSFYTTTVIRREPFEVACRLHEIVREVYEEYGYKLIDVPPFDIEGRFKFVTQKINETDFEIDDQDKRFLF